MRTIGQLQSQETAQRFCDFLYVQNIPNQIEQGHGGNWDIWVHSDDDLEKAKALLEVFRANPADARFAESAKASSLREEHEKELKQYQKKVRTRGQLFRRFAAYQMGPVTIGLIALSIYMFFRSGFGDEIDPIRSFLFSEFIVPQIGDRFLASVEIRNGEVWRLITPIFLHGGYLHIIFNMLWMRDLGGMVESVEGTGKIVTIVTISAAISNWAQYLVTGDPAFGGMSGVIYALLGYVWMKGKYHPGSGLFLHKETVVMMLIWLVVCFSNKLGPIANYAHLGGLIVGVAWGFVEAKRAA